jgi:hypothetical protein
MPINSASLGDSFGKIISISLFLLILQENLNHLKRIAAQLTSLTSVSSGNIKKLSELLEIF